MDPMPYGTTGGLQPVPMHPQEHTARRRAVLAATLQLISPFLFIGVQYFGLEVDIPIGGDPHGYAQIFGFFASFVLAVPWVALLAIAIPLLNKSRRSGAVLLIIAAAFSCLMFVIIASGYPGGIMTWVWSRVVTTSVGIVWAVFSGWCVWAGARAASVFPRR